MHLFYTKNKQRIYNKITQSALQSDFANFAVDQAARLAHGKFTSFFVEIVNIVNSML